MPICSTLTRQNNEFFLPFMKRETLWRANLKGEPLSSKWIGSARSLCPEEKLCLLVSSHKLVFSSSPSRSWKFTSKAGYGWGEEAWRLYFSQSKYQCWSPLLAQFVKTDFLLIKDVVKSYRSKSTPHASERFLSQGLCMMPTLSIRPKTINMNHVFFLSSGIFSEGTDGSKETTGLGSKNTNGLAAQGQLYEPRRLWRNTCQGKSVRWTFDSCQQQVWRTSHPKFSAFKGQSHSRSSPRCEGIFFWQVIHFWALAIE